MFLNLKSLRKKKKFKQLKTRLDTPSPKRKKENSSSSYEALCKEFGRPRRNALDGEPSISGFGIASFPNGKQFVQDCVTGKIIERTSDVRYIGQQNGLHFYCHPKSDYNSQVEAVPSFAEPNVA